MVDIEEHPRRNADQPSKFRDRRDAGRRLATEMLVHAGEDPLVLALPRGGVPVGYEIATALRAPLDVWIVRKVGVPWHEELGVGAVAEGGHAYLSEEMLNYVGLSADELSAVVEAKRREVEQRVHRFRSGRPRPDLRGRTVILVDDGIATGGTVHAAIDSIRRENPAKIVLAVPVAPPETIESLERRVDRVVCLLEPPDLFAIGLWYEDFEQVSDDEVIDVLDRARRERGHPDHAGAHHRTP